MRRLPMLPAVLALAALALPAAATPLLRQQGDAEERYRFLAGLVEKGLNELAVEEARSFLEDFPRHPKADLARYRLASALFALERLPEAEPLFAALAVEPHFEYRAECLFRTGQCALADGRVADARRSLEAVLREGQDYLHPAALYLLGDCAHREGELDEAEKLYQQVLRSAPESEHARASRRALVWCAWESGDAEATVTLGRAYLERHGDQPDAAEVRVLVGEALLEAGRPEEALAAYRSVAEESSAHEAALRGIAYAHAARDDHAAAAAAFEELLERYPEGRFVAEARLRAGVHRLLAGDARAAEAALARADAGDPEVLFWLARAKEANGDDEGALQALERAASAGPEPPLAERIAVMRGALLQALGRTDQALRAFEQADSDYALAAAAVAALNEGDSENAARLAARLHERSPRGPYRRQALFVLGESAFQAEDWPTARERFAALLADLRAGEPSASATPGGAVEGGAAPETTEATALSRVAWCDYMQGERETAARGFEELVERHPQAPEAEEALYMAGRAHREADETDAAVRAWRRYLKRFPEGEHEAEVLYALGNLSGESTYFEALADQHRGDELGERALFELAERASAAGDTEAAKKAYEDLLRLAPDGPLADRASYGLAWILHDEGRSSRALPLIERVLDGDESDPELVSASLELAVWAYAAAGDAEKAEEAWREYVPRAPDDRERQRAARRVAEAWRAEGRHDRARAVFEELLRSLSDPEVAVDVLVEGTYAALDEGDVDRAEAQVRVASRQGVGAERVGEATFFVAEARFERGEDERAAELYARAAESGGAFADEALYKLGFTRLRNDDLDGAAEAFRRVVAEHAGSELWGESLFLLGEARYRAGRYEDALRALERLRREKPDHEVMPKALFRLGLAAGRLERWPEAEDALSRLAREHEDFPQLAEAELWRGKALAAQRKTRAARQAFERVVALDRGALAAEARLETGHLLRGEGRTEEALAEYLKVAVLYRHPEHVPAALVAAGECLEDMGDPERARERYAEVLEDWPESSWAERARAAMRRLDSR